MIEELRHEMAKHGFHPSEITLNNRWYRFKADRSDDKKSAWLIGYETGGAVIASFGNWKTGEHHVFSPGSPTAHYLQEQKKFIAKMEKENTEAADRAAVEASERMASSAHANYLTPYLKRKNIRELFGSRPGADTQMGAHLLIPMRNSEGELRSVQRIRNDGERKYLFGTAKRGLMHILKSSPGPIYIAEGFATTATLCQALEHGTFICAFDAGNMVHVARAVFDPSAKIIICADNDETGIKAAEDAAKAIGATIVISPEGDFNDIGEERTREAFKDIATPELNEEIILQSVTKKNSLDSLKMLAACEGKIIYDSRHSQWYKFYSVWRPAHEDDIHKLFMQTLDRGILDGYSSAQYESFFKATRRRLARSQGWNTDKNLLPFANGVLDSRNLKLARHDPKLYFNWSVPYDYNPRAKSPTINRFLKELAQGDSRQEEILVAFLAATMRGRSDLQRYLELIGLPGTGKSTYIKLAQNLVGMRENTITTSMGSLDSRFETASFYGKRLILITDAEQYSKSVEVFKSLTGQDPIRHEKKGKDVGEPFIYDGMVLVAANNPIQFDDKSTAIARRRVSVHIDKPLDHVDSKINEKIAAELSGIVNRILEIPNEWIESTLGAATSLRSPSRIRGLIETNTVAAWLDECCTFEVDYPAKVGVKKRLMNGSFEHADTHLFPNYLRWANETNRKEMSAYSFSHALQEIIAMQRWPVERKKFSDKGWHYFGMRILRSGEQVTSIFLNNSCSG